MKTILITGGSRGIGAGLVRHFCAQGWRAAFCYRKSAEQARALADETGALALPCDVRDEAQVREMTAHALRWLGHLDALIVNAGAAWAGLLEEMPADAYDLVADTNQRGAFLCVREALPHLRAARGSIVLVSSMWGGAGASCEAAYSASSRTLSRLAVSTA